MTDYTIYKTNAIGTITISNSETAEIRNVKVKFQIRHMKLW